MREEGRAFTGTQQYTFFRKAAIQCSFASLLRTSPCELALGVFGHPYTRKNRRGQFVGGEGVHVYEALVNGLWCGSDLTLVNHNPTRAGLGLHCATSRTFSTWLSRNQTTLHKRTSDSSALPMNCSPSGPDKLVTDGGFCEQVGTSLDLTCPNLYPPIQTMQLKLEAARTIVVGMK